MEWLPNYQKEWLKGDMAAGLTVGIMLIPQGMAYAIIAGLPPVYGLYAALIPQVVYAFFGTSRQLAVGPVAMDSLLVAAGVSAFAAAGSEHYIFIAISIAFLMGVMQLLLGVFRMGFLVNFLSKPVISGFTSAAALVIGLSQLKYLLGVDLPRSNKVHEVLWNAVQHLHEVHWLTLAIGIGGIVLIKYAKKIHKAMPGALLAVVVGTAVVYFGKLTEQGVSIVGDIPTGIPAFQIPTIDMELIGELIPLAATIALIAFMESISVAKAVQARHKDYEVDSNQELIALGMSNIVGSLFQSYPITGGFSRTAVNDQAGAKTGVAPFISAVLIALTLLFLTPLFYYLPKAMLASIIMVAVFGLIDFKYPVFLWKTRKDDFFMLLATFVVTLSVGIQQGIAVGVGLSIIMVIYRSAMPHFAVLGRLKGTTGYRNVGRFPDVEVRDDVLVLRWDAQLYFANSDYFRDTVRELVAEKGEKLKLIVINSASINAVDASALGMLSDLVKDLKASGITFALSGVKGPVRDVMFHAGLMEEIGREQFFLDIQDAIDYLDGKPKVEAEASVQVKKG